MIWEGTLDPESLALLKAKQAKGYTPATFDPTIADRINTVQTRAPWLDPATSLSLAKGYASNAAIDSVGSMAGKQSIDNQGSNLMASSIGVAGKGVKLVTNSLGFASKWLAKAIDVVPGALDAVGNVGDFGYSIVNSSGVKTVSRYGMAALDVIPELTHQAASMIAQPLLHQQHEGVGGGFWDSTSIGQLLSNPDEQGEGFFISEDLRQQQASAARHYRGTINGSAFTIGRGAASLVFKPGSQMYANVSGVIDAIVQIKLPDPTRLLGVAGMDLGIGARKYHVPGIFEVAQKVKGEVPLISKADRPLISTVKNAGTPLESVVTTDALDKYLADIRNGVAGGEAGLSHSLAGGDLNMQQYTTFMRTKPSAQRLTAKLIDEKNAGKIHEGIFGGDITTDMAYDLSRATSEDQVHAILAGAYQFGSDTASRNLGDYAGMMDLQLPYPSQVLKKTRLFSEVPDALIVTAGDSLDNTKAVKNMVLSMRAAAVPEETITEMHHELVKAFRVKGSSSQDVADQIDAFNNVIKASLKANKIDDVVINEVIGYRKTGIDQLKSYFKNRSGIATDNGLLHTQLENVKDFLSVDDYNNTLHNLATSGAGWGSDVAFGGAMQYADMVSRTHMLPDPRRLRRLTRNSLFTEMLVKLPAGEEGVAAIGKLPIMGKRAIRDVEEITDKVAYDAIQKEMKDIRDAYPSGVIPHVDNVRLRDLATRADDLTTEVSKKVITGEQRLLTHALEYIQNGVWKPATLMTFGYTMRNAIDAQVRIAMGGYDGVITHPLEYMMLLMGKKSGKIGKGMQKSLLGDDLLASGSLKDPESAISKMAELKGEFQSGLLGSARVRGIGSSDLGTHMYKTNSWADVSRADPGKGKTFHTEGIIQQSSKIHRDPAQQAAALGFTMGLHEDEIAAKVVQSIRANTEVYKDIEQLYKRGIEYIDPATGVTNRFPPVDFRAIIAHAGKKEGRKAVDQILDAHARRIVMANVGMHGGGLDEIHFMQAFDHVPQVDEFGKMRRVVVDQTKVTNVHGVAFADSVKAGDKVLMEDGKTIGWVVKDEMSGTSNMLTVVPSQESGALTGSLKGSRGARTLVARQAIYDEATGKGLPEKVTREVLGTHADDMSHMGQIQKGMDQATNWFFNSLNERETRFLERSPVFRQSYYNHVGEHLDKLSSVEARKMLTDIGAVASKEGKNVGQYIGNAAVAKRLEKIASKASHKGTLTVEELDDYAKFRGLSDTQNLLFDASSTNNLTDIARIIVPFGGAWSEVIGTYLKKSLHDNVHMYRQFSRVYNGARNADPDQDGRGFFYKDPQTNKPMFMFPFSAEISRIFTGDTFSAGLGAPVQRLSQGINIYPGVGPMMQFGLSNVVPDKPQYDSIMNLLLPYGRNKSAASVIDVRPGWERKLQEAIIGNTNSLTTNFANTYMETVKAEASGGGYDLSQVSEQERLKENAKHKAQWLTGLRAISQFMGPTSGSLEFQVTTNQGDVYVREMAAEFSKLQSDDYDSSVDRFLKLHGNNAALYVSAKSRLAEGQTGLETTTEFGAWERTNGELINSYKPVINYFAPPGDGFDFDTLRRQIEGGKREMLTDTEMIALAQNRIGASRYRAARVAMGAYPNESQRQKLSDYRISLNAEYPGFPPKAEFTSNEFSNQVAELGRILQDPRVATNDLTPALRQYLTLREQAVSANGGKGLGSKKAQRARQQLWEQGQALALSNPSFDRIWQRLLIKEVED